MQQEVLSKQLDFAALLHEVSNIFNLFRFGDRRIAIYYMNRGWG